MGPATSALEEALNKHGLHFRGKEGDAAFYGPKIDIDVRCNQPIMATLNLN